MQSNEDTPRASPPGVLNWDGQSSPHFLAPPKGTGMLRTPLSCPQAPLSSGAGLGRQWENRIPTWGGIPMVLGGHQAHRFH